MKKLLILVLVFSMLLPYAVFGAEKDVAVISDAAYKTIDAMWQELYAAEKRTLSDAENAKSVAASVVKNELYIDGSLRWNGEDHFTFETTTGVTCAYSARLRNIAKNAEPNEAALAEPEVQTLSYAAKGEPATDVYLIEPYYGIDYSFSKQYQNEATSIIEAVGGTYHLYTGEAATIDAVAEAIESGAIVIFDSHGDTDYARGTDYTSGAKTSYLLLQTGAGLTTADYAFDPIADTYHAVNYGSDGEGMFYYAVDGTCIKNHMDGKAPNSLLWMAICLSMATDGLQAPLREMGVEVAYGYSQEVTFQYDYAWEEVFFDALKLGETVADAVAKMKSEVGLWDLCEDYISINAAKRNDCAFPIVVSSEDAYPGHGNVDNLQTVNSTWTIAQAGWNDEAPSEETTEPSEESTEPSEESTEPSEESTEPSEESTEPSEESTEPSEESTEPSEESTEPSEESTEPSEESTEPSEESTEPSEESTEPSEESTEPSEESTEPSEESTEPSEESTEPSEESTEPSEESTEPSEESTEPSEESTEPTEESTEPSEEPTEPNEELLEYQGFTDVDENNWFYPNVVFAYTHKLMNGVGENQFAPNGNVTRAMLVTILYRNENEPKTDSLPNPFADISNGQWYTEAVIWAAGNGVVKGMSAATFEPDTAITREQVATILHRYAQFKQMNPDGTEPEGYSNFADVNTVSEYAREAMKWCVGAKIIGGIDGKLAPKQTATRAQIAAMLQRYLEF